MKLVFEKEELGFGDKSKRVIFLMIGVTLNQPCTLIYIGWRGLAP
jgi:hypothetical protein